MKVNGPVNATIKQARQQDDLDLSGLEVNEAIVNSGVEGLYVGFANFHPVLDSPE